MKTRYLKTSAASLGIILGLAATGTVHHQLAAADADVRTAHPSRGH